MKVELAEIYRDTSLGREAEALLLPCVQCGQCTFTCPTFRLLDDEWDGPHEWSGINYTCNTKVGGAEKVTVPAGTFTALPLTQSYTNFQPPQAWTAWHAPGVGRVKFVDYEGQGYVLLKFTPGKEKK